MSMEAFLINRPRKVGKRKKSGARKRKRGGGLPSGLLSRMIRTHGIKRGMKEAWKAHRAGARNPKLPPSYHRKKAKHRPVVYSGVKKGVWARSPFSRSPRLNPFGEEVMIVGNKPRKRVRRRKSARSNPARRVRHRYSMKRNDPGRKRVYHRRHIRRRNPARSGVPAISMRRPMSLLIPAIAGMGGFFAADYIPAAIGMSATPLTRIGVKAGVAFGGGMLVSKFMGSKSGMFFSVGAGINVLNDVLRTYVFKTGAITGFGAFSPRKLAGFGAMSPYSDIRSPYAS